MYNRTIEIVRTVDTMTPGISARRLDDQFVRSVTGILANSFLAQHAAMKKEFIDCLSMALPSGNESKLWLSTLRDARNMSMTPFKLILAHLSAFCGVIAAALLSAEKSLLKETKLCNP
ncbi:MAG: four helix bundle protein [Chitinophagales bacterium]